MEDKRFQTTLYRLFTLAIAKGKVRPDCLRIEWLILGDFEGAVLMIRGFAHNLKSVSAWHRSHLYQVITPSYCTSGQS
jgi:hypothetical protein